MPSAKGIKGSIQKPLDPEASSAGKSAGSKIGTALKLGTAAAVAGLGVIIAKSISAGADLEQSIGGIETLFKDSANIMRNYADNAYKTVGVSANDYMENVTSFSASLLQSMGGDTEAAARVAHMAMVDMGDNANKMGTDMGDIQNAYQGFAKENYTMLDNLKLGYGGTKSEMERLLKDATALTGVKYDISNLDDVYNAIHAVQEEIGITGTTALEAEETISGSLSALKASFSNLLGNIALGEDLWESLNSLAQPLSTFLFGNLLPMIGNILGALPGALITFIQVATPEFLEVGAGMLRSLSEGLVTGWPVFMQGLSDVLTSVNDWLIEQFPTIAERGIELISNFATGLLDGIPGVISSMTGILYSLLSALFNAMPTLMQSGFELIVNLAKGIWKNLPQIVSTITNLLTMLLNTILARGPDMIRQGLGLIGKLATGLWNNLPMIITTIGNLLASLIQKVGSYLPRFLTEGLKLIGEMAVGIINAIPGIVSKIPQVIRALVGAFKNISSQFKSIGSDLIKGLWNGISSVKNWIMGKIKGFVGDVTSGIKSFFGIKSPSRVMADQVGKFLPMGLAEGIEDNVKPVTDAMSNLTDLTTGTMTSELAMTASMSGSAYNSSAPQKGINVTQHITSPDPLSEREMARQTRLNLQRLAYQL